MYFSTCYGNSQQRGTRYSANMQKPYEVTEILYLDGSTHILCAEYWLVLTIIHASPVPSMIEE